MLLPRNSSSVSRPLVATTVLLLAVAGCARSDTDVASPQADPGESASDFELDELLREQDSADAITAAKEAEIVQFCSGCHEPPRPSSFTKDAWEEEVEQGFDLFLASERTDLKRPGSIRLVVDYYRDKAPEAFEFPNVQRASGKAPVTFKRADLEILPGAKPPTISHLYWSRKTEAHPAGLLACDMEFGRLIWTDPLKPEASGKVLETFQNPASVNVVDLDADGTLEYLVGDLGSLTPADHSNGKVYLLRFVPGSGQWTKQLLLGDVGRVVDIETADFDGDDDLDLIVSVFGWRKSGNLLLLRNQSTESQPFEFVEEEIDPRSGAIQVEKCDLNKDGLLDFVTVFSQEHEKVVAFMNQGQGKFLAETIFSAGFPSYGSSGIELVDMDVDGDLDVLYTNGDSFDDFLIKPYHTVQWLENEGAFPFARHELANMPGVHRALAGDIDGDEDIDVVAVALLPEHTRNPEIDNLDSIVLLEQAADGTFVRHSLEKRSLQHATCELGDFDGDGDLDLAVGVFMDRQNDVRMKLFWNQLTP